MALLKVHKFVAALPDTLEANALYFVRADTGFDLYATNYGGTIVAYSLNSPPKGLSSSCAGKPAASEMVGSGIAPYALTLSAANSKAEALVAATASTVFLIKRDGTQIGTITFAAAGTTGTIAYSSTAITEDQHLTIHAPATPDATLADLSFLLKG